MATNEVVERDDICLMDTDELHEHLIEAGFSEETSSVIKENGISGEDFLELNREDFAILFPNDFMIGKRLNKYVANFNTTLPSMGQPSTSSSLDNTIEISPASTPVSTQKTPSESPVTPPATSQTTPTSSRKRAGGPSMPSFSLPKFDAVLERALAEDGFYDPNTRAKLIRKACEHLEGFCLEHGLEITKERQDELATLLLERAPHSLSDPSVTTKRKSQSGGPANGLKEQIRKWFYNHAFAIKKSLGETKKKKKGKDDDEEISPEPQDDEETLKAHCALIEKECKKKDGAKDYNKIFRLLTATREYRRKWMLGMSAPTRVTVGLNTYPCLKKPLMAFNDFIVEHKEQVETVEELEAKLKGLGDRFCNVTLPAILQLAKQQGESVDLNDTSILEKLIVMLKFILKSLRCSKKEKLSEAVKSILFVSEDPSEVNIYSRTNTSPFMVVEGTLSEPKHWYIMCEKRMATYKITAKDTLVTGLITLVAVYFTYYLEYKKDVFLALTFLQEKLTNTPVSIAPKTHYNNLFRSVTLFEQKVTPTEPSAEI